MTAQPGLMTYRRRTARRGAGPPRARGRWRSDLQRRCRKIAWSRSCSRTSSKACLRTDHERRALAA